MRVSNNNSLKVKIIIKKIEIIKYYDLKINYKTFKTKRKVNINNLKIF